MSDFYILENKKIKEVLIDEWVKWVKNPENRIIKHDECDKILVSTVFLGIDHNWSGKGEPVLFETMIFGGKYNNYQERYTSYEDAIKGHKKAKKLIIDQKKQQNKDHDNE